MRIPRFQDWSIHDHLPIRGSGALIGAGTIFLAAILLTAWSFTTSQSTAATAQRVETNLLRAQRATARLLEQRPAHIKAADFQQTIRTIDQAVAEAISGGGVVRNQIIRTLGPVTNTKSMRQQEHLEIANLSLEQALRVVDNLEHGLEACWIETAELTPAPQDRWNLLLEIHWLTYADENGR